MSPSPENSAGSRTAGNLLMLAGVAGFLGVAIGAFGAHGLKDVLIGERGEWFATGVHYHLFHAPMIAVCGVLAREGARTRAARFAAASFALGILLFSFSLYALALGAPRICGAVTPFGGVGFLVGWFAIARIGLLTTREP